MNEFSQCLDSKKYYYQVKLNLDKSMNSFGIQSTPTFLLINTSGEQQQIRGAQSYSVFERVIESLL